MARFFSRAYIKAIYEHVLHSVYKSQLFLSSYLMAIGKLCFTGLLRVSIKLYHFICLTSAIPTFSYLAEQKILQNWRKKQQQLVEPKSCHKPHPNRSSSVRFRWRLISAIFIVPRRCKWMFSTKAAQLNRRGWGVSMPQNYAILKIRHVAGLEMLLEIGDRKRQINCSVWQLLNTLTDAKEDVLEDEWLSYLFNM